MGRSTGDKLHQDCSVLSAVCVCVCVCVLRLGWSEREAMMISLPPMRSGQQTLAVAIFHNRDSFRLLYGGEARDWRR
jgi:hypothetical protein